MRAHCHARFHLRADPILRDAIDGQSAHRRIRHIDHFRINAGPNRLEHGLASAFRSEIDRARAIEIERDASLVRRDQREDHLRNVAARQIMRFKRIARNIDPRFHRRDSIIDDHSDRHFPQPHADHFSKTDRRVCDSSANPETEEIEKDDAEDEREKREHRDTDKIKGLHGRRLAKRFGRGKIICCSRRPVGDVWLNHRSASHSEAATEEGCNRRET